VVAIPIHAGSFEIPNVRGLPVPNDPEMLKWLENEWNARRLTRPQDAVTRLLQSPDDFLRKHPIINTFDCNAHGPTRAYFRNDRADALRPGSLLGTRSLHTTESFNLETISGANAYGYAFPVQGVYTSKSNAPLWYTLDGNGPAMMLTAKLTGCTFVATAGTGTNVQVTHLQPEQVSGLEVSKSMQGPGRSAYGQEQYDFDKRSINIIGVRVGGRWNIWAQKLVKNASPPKILSVKRIWPL
jgi:hypothetical protein